MTTISLKIPSSLGQRLGRAARERHVSRSELVRQAVERFLEESPNAQDTWAARAGDLIGCVKEGPTDLSYNEEYMKDFGK